MMNFVSKIWYSDIVYYYEITHGPETIKIKSLLLKTKTHSPSYNKFFLCKNDRLSTERN